MAVALSDRSMAALLLAGEVGHPNGDARQAGIQRRVDEFQEATQRQGWRTAAHNVT